MLNYYENIQEIVRISSGEEAICKHCEFKINQDFLDKSIVRYIKSHGYKILQIGQETSRDRDNNKWQSTSAILGK